MSVCNEYRVRGRGELPRIPAYVWVLRNTSQYLGPNLLYPFLRKVYIYIYIYDEYHHCM
jgi:hypothetical protein